MILKRFKDNPILLPNGNNPWEALAAFNPSVAADGKQVHLVYRATGLAQKVGDASLEFSTIGRAVSADGLHFTGREQFIKPDYDWEKLGCEDPRITKFEGRYFIFYTALSAYPFSAEGIKIGVAVTSDFKTIEKHPVTPFNAKAMALFPERIGGKISALLTVNTDRPPARICLALFDRIEDIWSEAYWRAWYAHLDEHIIPIPEDDRDHIELGSPPVKTKSGWLVFYAYIFNYFSPPPTFGVQAVLLDLENPARMVGEVKRPFLFADQEYERYGRVSNIVFPSGAALNGKKLRLYYGGADTVACEAEIKISDLVEELVSVHATQLKRFAGNPIIRPVANHPWESKATFNPGAVREAGRVHLLYRAMSGDNTSTLGYASSPDGLRFDQRLTEPAYVPRADFERKLNPGCNSGCEDPRITKLGDKFHVCYTAYDGRNSPRIALTSIRVEDFLRRRWEWTPPVLISPPGVDDKDAAIFPEKIGGKYVFLHRLGVDIWIDYRDSLEFDGRHFIKGGVLMAPRDTSWDSKKIGIAGPPIKTKKGWLLVYHGISRRTNHYNLRAALLDLKNPSKIIARTRDTILEPTENYEKNGVVPNVVFSCGMAVVNGDLIVYYGAADKVVCAALVPLQSLVLKVAL